MNLKQVVGLLLIVAGILGLIYKNFSYTRETHEAKLGPLEFSVAEKETVDVPQWLAVGAIVAGALVLVWKQKS
jgi:multidrug transporter EmrE-like cation transporter